MLECETLMFFFFLIKHSIGGGGGGATVQSFTRETPYRPIIYIKVNLIGGRHLP